MIPEPCAVFSLSHLWERVGERAVAML